MPELHDENVNLLTCPKINATPDTNAKIAFGDLDGNAIKFLYFLIHEGVLQLPAQNYDKLVEIYRTPTTELTKATLDEFSAIIRDAVVIKPSPKITFIGDDLADRGMNDLYTLKIFEKLSHGDINFEIITSNHGAQFLKQYAVGLDQENITLYTYNNHAYGNSLHNLQTLIKNSATTGVTLDEVDRIMTDIYLPRLKLFSYEKDNSGELNIYSHAPIDATKIKAVAKLFQVEFNDSTQDKLMQTIDKINQQFQLKVFNQDKQFLEDLSVISQLEILVNDRYGELANNTLKHPENYPQRDYTVKNIHGHVGTEKPVADVSYSWKYVNLDGNLGKGNNMRDVYHVYTNNANYRDISNKTEKDISFDSEKTASASKQGIFSHTTTVQTVIDNPEPAQSPQVKKPSSPA